MIHLYGENNIEMIINRFDLNTRKAKFLHFVRQIINLKIKMKNNFLGMLEVQEKKIKLLQLIWKLRFFINSKKQGLFDKDRIPFNWYKLGLLHILCFEKIKDVDFWDLKWPIFPLEREEIVKLKKQLLTTKLKNYFSKLKIFG